MAVLAVGRTIQPRWQHCCRRPDTDIPIAAVGHNLGRAVLTSMGVHVTTGASSANRLGLAGFTVDANRNVLRDGVIIGTLNANGGIGTEDLIVTYNANATRAVVQDLLRAVTFKTIKGTIGIRDAVFSLTDGDGGTSDDVTKVINVS